MFFTHHSAALGAGVLCHVWAEKKIARMLRLCLLSFDLSPEEFSKPRHFLLLVKGDSAIGPAPQKKESGKSVFLPLLFLIISWYIKKVVESKGDDLLMKKN